MPPLTVLPCPPQPSDKLENGSISFLDVISVKHGLDMLQGLGGMARWGISVRFWLGRQRGWLGVGCGASRPLPRLTSSLPPL